MKYEPSMLSAYLDEELNPAERQLVEKVIAEDADARETLKALRNLRDQLAALPIDSFQSDLLAEVWRKIALGPDAAIHYEGNEVSLTNQAQQHPATSSPQRRRTLRWTLALAAVAAVFLLAIFATTPRDRPLASTSNPVASSVDSPVASSVDSPVAVPLPPIPQAELSLQRERDAALPASDSLEPVILGGGPPPQSRAASPRAMPSAAMLPESGAESATAEAVSPEGLVSPDGLSVSPEGLSVSPGGLSRGARVSSPTATPPAAMLILEWHREPGGSLRPGRDDERQEIFRKSVQVNLSAAALPAVAQWLDRLTQASTHKERGDRGSKIPSILQEAFENGTPIAIPFDGEPQGDQPPPTPSSQPAAEQSWLLIIPFPTSTP